MCLPKIWQARSVPVTFVSMMPSHVSSETVSVGSLLILPAQLTRISTLPNAFTVPSSSTCRLSRSATSELSRSDRRPVASIAFAASSTCSGPRKLATTSAPASARPIAIAKPIPDVPPTTTADLPFKSNNGCPIENVLFLLSKYSQNSVLSRRDLRKNLIDNLSWRSIVHNPNSITRHLECRKLTLQQLRTHELMLPLRQTSRKHLLRRLEQNKAYRTFRHSRLQRSPITRLQRRAGQNTTLPFYKPVPQQSVQHLEPRLSILIIEWMPCSHLLPVRNRMIIIAIGKHSAQALSKQRPDSSLARSAHTHQHNNHPAASSPSSSTSTDVCRIFRVALTLEATSISPKSKTRIGYIEDLFPTDCVPTIRKRGRIVLRRHLHQVAILEVNSFDLLAGQMAWAISNRETAFAGAMDEVGGRTQITGQLRIFFDGFEGPGRSAVAVLANQGIDGGIFPKFV